MSNQKGSIWMIGISIVFASLMIVLSGELESFDNKKMVFFLLIAMWLVLFSLIKSKMDNKK